MTLIAATRSLSGHGIRTISSLRAQLLIAATAILFGGSAVAQQAAPTLSQPLLLSTTSFIDGGVIPDKYSQASQSPVLPALSWTNVPTGTQSFTLVMHDPDGAPHKGSADVLHWMVFNIPGSTVSLPEGLPTTTILPNGAIQPNNSCGHPGFMAPGWEKDNYHHYTIELYALDIKLNLGTTSTRDQVLAAMDGHVIGKAAIEGRFHH